MARTKTKKKKFELNNIPLVKEFVTVAKNNDAAFLIVTAILLSIGLLWVCSTTQIVSTKGDFLIFSSSKVRMQLIALAGGLIMMMIAATINFDKTFRKFKIMVPVYVVTCILLAITLKFKDQMGASRWISLGKINIQTAEFAKIVIIMFVAAYMDDRKKMLDIIQNAFKALYPFILSAPALVLIAAEPDIGIPTLTFFGICSMLYVAGVPIGNIVRVLFFSIPAFVLDSLRNVGHRLGRIQSYVLSAFTDQPVDILGDAYQISNSLIGICSGGILGRGFAHSHQKTHLLTQHESDFVFAVYAEETGLVGSLILMALFSVLVYYCYKITINTKDLYYRSLGMGLTFILAVQAFYSIAVNANFAPVKGIALPFISYGGSSLVSTLIIIGIMMNIAAHEEKNKRR
ncbi:MAG: FtsW/RodA/SpoVE family cell cycle protein [Elusimicrobiales bacterium]|nr:FtsW/RodA/SpoVE family cell cycle protein [Elusimicrobiales bacterium]